MTTESLPDDLHRIWQDQLQEEDSMELDNIRSKAAAFARRSRRQDLAAGTGLSLAIAGNAVAVAFERNNIERAGDVLAILACLYILSYYWRRREAAPGLLGAASTIDHYRREVARRQAMVRHFWTRLALPFLPGIMLSIFGGAIASPWPASRYVIAAVTFVLIVGGNEWANRREARRLEAEFAALEI